MIVATSMGHLYCLRYFEACIIDQAANEAVDSLEALVPALFAFDIPGSLAAVKPALRIAGNQGSGLHTVVSRKEGCATYVEAANEAVDSAPLSSTYASAFCLSSLFGSAVYNFVSGSKNSFRSLAVTAGSTAVGFFGGSFLEQVYLSACVLLASD